MGIYNILLADSTCPICSKTSETNIQFRLGWLDLNRYKIGDRLIWQQTGIHEPRERPADGNLDGEGVASCDHCYSDYWVIVAVRNDVISSVEVDTLRDAF